MADFALSCLWTSMAAAVAAAVVSVRHRHLARAASVVMAAGSAIPTAVLAHALWTLDLSFTYVADHARAGISGPYRLSGLWGGASGSLLLFTCMTATAVTALIWTQSSATEKSAALWGSLSVAVLTAAILGTANPFRRLAIPAIDGTGMQPILEHPAMLYHPPLLYLGQISTIVPFLIAVATTARSGRREASPHPEGAPLKDNKGAPDGAKGSKMLEHTRRKELRFWLGVSLALLTAGLATGSNWAYVELGWGGFWGWDPVENGILAAWLSVVAALHAVGQPRHGRIVRIACGSPWILVLVAASVTRAGVGGSVHAFADDERVSWILTGLVLATATVLGSTRGSLPWRQGRHQSRNRQLRTVCAALSAAAALIVLVGVLYPIPAPGEPLVTGLYYATLLAPLAILGLLGGAAAVARGRMTAWAWPAMGSLVGMAAAAAAGALTPFALCVAAGVGAMLANTARGLRAPTRRQWPMRTGHLGFAVLLIGIAGSTLAEKAAVGLDIGEQVELGGLSFRHIGVEVGAGPAPGSDAVVGTVEVREDGDLVTELRPSLVAFPDRGVLLAETALHSRPARDIQAVLRDASDTGAVLYSLSVAPLVMWVWMGALLMTGAGLMAAFSAAAEHRRRQERKVQRR